MLHQIAPIGGKSQPRSGCRRWNTCEFSIMEKLPLPPDFKDFLQLLNSEKVEYLLLGGYAVGHYGYPRATGDLDIWIAANPGNAARVAETLWKSGFSTSTVRPEMFSKPDQIIRMGVPPICIDIITSASGVEFASCFSNRNVHSIDGVEVNIIHPDDLKRNKLATGRAKDLNDLENLP
jgi:hypothetical protein